MILPVLSHVFIFLVITHIYFLCLYFSPTVFSLFPALVVCQITVGTLFVKGDIEIQFIIAIV